MMGSSGTRTTLATGIYQDAYGVSVVASKGSGADKRTAQQRFPLGTPLETLRATYRDLKQELKGYPRAKRGSLAEDIAKYLEVFPPTSARRRDEAALLQHWIDAGFGDQHRASITALRIRQQLGAWSGRFKPATLNHLRRALGAVYRAVNGRSGENPVRDVPKLLVRYDEPRAIDYTLIEFIFDHFPDVGRAAKGSDRPTVNKTKLRYRVMAYTGLPPAQLGRVLPRDLNLRARTVYGRPRRKGEGVDGYVLPLTVQGAKAFKAFADAQCFGPFSARSAAKSWRAAVTKAKVTWLKTHRTWPLPDDVRAYDLRHSFGTAVQQETGDLQATADLLMHASLSTTRRYTKGAVTPRMKAAADAVGRRWKTGTT